MNSKINNNKELRILILEDNPIDAELMERELRKEGFSIKPLVVDNKDKFIGGLLEFNPDFILADYHLPTFNGLDALIIAKQMRPPLPFILVSGTIGEEAAVAIIKMGADDFILKRNLTRLGPAMTHALHEKELIQEREWRKKEEILRKEREEFTSLVVHQLRAPITAIIGFSELLLDKSARKLDNNEVDSLKEILHAAKERLLVLVNAMLNSLRIELGTLAIEPISTDLTELIDSVLNEILPAVKLKQLKIKKEYDHNISPINVDPKLTRTVFQNIITNAVKYTSKEGEIKVSLFQKDNEIIFSVSDAGCGIPKEQQQKIFQKLFRADNARSIDPDGTGLGLYIAKSVIEQSGGKIWFESEENKGSTFYISIPLIGMKEKEGIRGLT